MVLKFMKFTSFFTIAQKGSFNEDTGEADFAVVIEPLNSPNEPPSNVQFQVTTAENAVHFVSHSAAKLGLESIQRVPELKGINLEIQEWAESPLCGLSLKCYT